MRAKFAFTREEDGPHDSATHVFALQCFHAFFEVQGCCFLKLVQVGSLLMRRLQTGFIYTYAIVMVLGVMFLVAWQFTDLFRAFF